MAEERVRVDSQSFEDAINKFKTCNTELQNAYSQMKSSVDALEGSWQGAASRAYMEQFKSLHENIKTSEQSVEREIGKLGTVQIAYEIIEQAADAIIKAVKDMNPFQN